MGHNNFDISHFLHISRKRHRKQRHRLKKLCNEDRFLVRPDEIIRDSRLIKYWRQRNSLFSKFGKRPIYLTEELWYSVTPENIAKFIAKFVKASLPNATKILDVFCGGGGNTIQLALEFEKVYGVDSSLDHLYCAYRNAASYGVSDRIWLKCGSWEKLVKKGRFSKIGIDFAFASPPWGGPQYLKEEVYDLETSLEPMGITQLLGSLFSVTSNVMLFLPRNSDLAQLSRATREVLGPQGHCRIVYTRDNGFTKGILCIWGTSLVNAGREDEGIPRNDTSLLPSPSSDTVHYNLDG